MRPAAIRTVLLWTAATLVFLAIGYTVLRGCGISVFGNRLLNFCPPVVVMPDVDRPTELIAEDTRTEILRERLADLRIEIAFVDHCPTPAVIEAPPPEDDVVEEETADLGTEDLSTEEACAAGATETGLVDLYLLQDLSSSFRGDLPTIRRNVADIIAQVRAGGMADQFRMGVGSFIDKPVPGIGLPGNYTYRNHQNLTGDFDAVLAATRAMQAEDTADTPEAQLEALLEVAGRSSALGFRPNAARFVVVATDAGFHVAGDWRNAPRAEDGIPDDSPSNEDYPSVPQVRLALETADIVPIFVVKDGAIAPYRVLVNNLGRGVVVPLAGGSANLLESIFAGIDEACGSLWTATTLVMSGGFPAAKSRASFDRLESPRDPIDRTKIL